MTHLPPRKQFKLLERGAQSELTSRHPIKNLRAYLAAKYGIGGEKYEG